LQKFSTVSPFFRPLEKLRMCSVLEFLEMERDGSVPRTRFCVRLRPPDETNSSHRREYSAQMRDGVIRPNWSDDAEPSRNKSPLTFSPKPSAASPCFFSPTSPSHRPAVASPSHRPLPLQRPLRRSSPSPSPSPAVQVGRPGGGWCEARRGRRLVRGSAATVGRRGGQAPPMAVR
jgi:hypothetical protein